MRLLSSLAAAAAVLADQAADRLDAWAEHNANTEDAPRETPLGFTVPTGERGKGIDVKGLTGEQRDRWLAEVKTRLDASTGGPWCTEERDNPTGRIISPYGVIATGVTREADRDLIKDARTDLFGLLALAEYDDQVIEALQHAARHQTERHNAAERELAGMHHRERQVDKVVAAWDIKRAGLKGYDGTIDPETPAGRVVELLRELCKARPLPNRDIEARTAALTAIENNLTEHGLTRGEGDYPDVIVDAVRLALADRCEALATITELERKLDAHHRHDAELTTADDVRAAAAARIRKAADEYEHLAKTEPGGYDAEGVNSYLAGMYESARIAADETSDADLNVAHIDTVNGRAAAADEQADDMPVVTPGSFIETVLATGGTVVIDDNGDPHVTDLRIGNDPAAIGTLITADGKRHRFAGGTASPVDGYVIESGDADIRGAHIPENIEVDENGEPTGGIILRNSNGQPISIAYPDHEDTDER